MKIFKWLTISPIVAMAAIPITSCSNARTYDINDYVIDLNWNQDESSTFNILQLTDLHFSNLTDNEKQFEFLQSTIDKAKKTSPTGKLDFIIITGDLFDFASKSDANQIIDFFEKQQIPWSCVFGNHDEQNYFSIEWFTSRLNEVSSKGGYCKFKDLQNDDVFGNCNFVIDLKHNNKSVEQLVMFDSNRYTFKEYVGYDYIHEDQIKWYDRVVTKFEMKKSLAFMHIPLPEFEENYQKAVNKKDSVEFITDETGVLRNKHQEATAGGAPQVNTGLYDHLVGFKGVKGYDRAHTQGLFIGHNHLANYCINVPGIIDNPNFDIKLCYGIKSSNKVECDKELGGQLISLDTNGAFKLYSVLNEYK